MKKIALLFAFSIGLWSMLNAQWVSPGNGTTYTMSDLVNVTNGIVTYDGDYHIHSDLTISSGDILKIDNGFQKIFIDGALITIYGSMFCENDNRVSVMGHPSFSMLFENAVNCDIRNMYFSDGAGIRLIESEVKFNDVKFVYFTTDYCHSAIDIFNCNPVIDDCYFLLNEGAAIGSPANGQSSPKILNCEFDSNNDVEGGNLPQINLGPGAEDTIYIVGNLIDGTYAHHHTGGISIADLMGTGDTKILLKYNTITNNRYGYNQQGYHLSSDIIENIFTDNCHEDNPMNGGSGISIYGVDDNNRAVIRDNVITGNLWGITAINAFDIDLGRDDDWGNNRIYNNRNSGETYDLYNNSAYDIKAVGNDWGTSHSNEIESHIVHQYDNPNLGWVNYTPFIDSDGINETKLSTFDISPNPVSNGFFNVTIEQAMTSEVVIYNINGQIVKSQMIYDKTNTIICSLKSGIYFVEIRNNYGKGVKKLVIK